MAHTDRRRNRNKKEDFAVKQRRLAAKGFPIEEGFTDGMRTKFATLGIVLLLVFLLLTARVFFLSTSDGDRYKRIVLAQQHYDSTVLPAKRGEIVDRNGTKIAVSQKVYNVILDTKTIVSEKGKYIEPSLLALTTCGVKLKYTEAQLRNYIEQNNESRYKVVAKKQPYEAIKVLQEAIDNPKEYPRLKGIWLEEAYQRYYPYNSLACDVIGFVQGDSEGTYGLEQTYDTELEGIDGRQYGYLDDDESLQRTIKPAEHGRTLVTSLDVNIQSIVEKHILAFNKEHENGPWGKPGSNNTGVIIMKPDTGEVLAMASYPVFDLNNPRDESILDVSVELPEETEDENSDDSSENDNNQSDSESESSDTPESSIEENTSEENSNTESEEAGSTVEKIVASQVEKKSYDELYEEAKTEALASLWKNFCINSTYEPGSTMKPFTMAMGLEEGSLSGEESYVCNGVLEIGDHKIHCSNRLGHGPLDFSGALENSCNVCFMKMGERIGKNTYLKYSKIFNFGLKTNIDLTGEALTNSLVFTNSMTPTDLAIGSFGQGFNTTMIQIATGFCSLVNGGKYIQPHLVTEVLDTNGATVEKIEPRVLRQTVSEETSEKIKQLCVNVVTEGTGKSARPAGYLIGGKTGTAETLPRGNKQYVVSFIGFAPAENPEVVIYTVIDRPNAEHQDNAKFATVLTKDILTEVLPYLNVAKTEEITEKEAEELKEKQIEFSNASTDTAVAEDENTEGESADNLDKNTASDSNNTPSNTIEIYDSNGNPVNRETVEEYKKPEVKIDSETGYAIDPETGILLDPETGAPVDGAVSNLQ